jgi:4-amino-4-deoxy-L-arabinose transferase-like glycosyltransferase
MATLAPDAPRGVLPDRRPRRWLLAWLALVTAFFLACSTPFLNDFPLLSGDEAWVMSVSNRLSASGRLGTDLFAGYFRAGEVYFINLPMHHFWQAAAFLTLGTGVWQARLVTIAAAVALVWIVGWLALRWYGLAVAVVSSGLLVFWSSGLAGGTIPLLQTGRTARYDLSSVCAVWVAVALMDRLARVPSAGTAVGLGVAAGVATLTQFHGAVAVLVAAVWWLWLWSRHLVPAVSGLYLAGGFAATVCPYAIYIVANWDAFVGQQSMHAARFGFSDLRFYLQNFFHEWRRFWIGGERPIGFWLFLTALGPAVWHLARRAARGRERADRLLVATLVVSWSFLALVESVKAPLYALILVPPISITLALGAVEAFRWRPRAASPSVVPAIVRGLVAAALLAVLVDGVATYRLTVRSASQAVTQDLIGASLRKAVPGGTVVAAFEAFWWPLRGSHSLRSWGSLWNQWAARPGAASDPMAFHDLLARAGVQYMLLSRPDQTYLLSQPGALREQTQLVMNRCSLAVTSVDLPWYGEVVVRELRACELGR